MGKIILLKLFKRLLIGATALLVFFLFFFFIKGLIFNNNIFLKRTAQLEKRPLPCFKDENFIFRNRFSEIFENLQINWQNSGNWRQDMMHDATSFAPPVLYKTGLACQEKNFLDQAEKTIDWEIGLIEKMIKQLFFLKKERNSDFENNIQPLNPGSGWFETAYQAFFGSFSLFDAHSYYQGSWYKQLKIKAYTRAGLLGADFLFLTAGKTADRLTSNIEVVRLIGWETIELMSVEANFRLYEKTKNPVFAWLGLKIFDRALAKHWQTDYYLENPWSWPEGLALSALYKAYGLTGKEDYLHKARTLLSYLENNLFSQTLSIFLEFPSSKIHPQSAYLSGNLFLNKALLDGYQFAGEKENLDKAQKSLKGMLSVFLEEGYLKHDISLQKNGYQVSGSYCTGCNFFALNLIIDFNRLQNL